jgi:hypothetical protein
MKGDNSVPKVAIKLKDSMSGNALLNSIIPIIRENGNIDSIYFNSVGTDKQSQDDITEGWEELFQINEDFASRLAKFAIAQSGLDNSPISFTKFMPQAIWNTIIETSLNNLDKKSADGIYDAVFYNKKNFRNSNLVANDRNSALAKGLDYFYSKDLNKLYKRTVSITTGKRSSNDKFTETPFTGEYNMSIYASYMNTIDVKSNSEIENNPKEGETVIIPDKVEVNNEFIKSYNGVDVFNSNNIVNKEGIAGAAKYTKNKILINKTLLIQKYKEKAWTNMRSLIEIINNKEITSNAKNLPEDAFTSYEEFENFVIEHEYQHSIYTRDQFNNDSAWTTTIGEYETEINNRALNSLEFNKFDMFFKGNKLEEFKVYNDFNKTTFNLKGYEIIIKNQPGIKLIATQYQAIKDTPKIKQWQVMDVNSGRIFPLPNLDSKSVVLKELKNSIIKYYTVEQSKLVLEKIGFDFNVKTETNDNLEELKGYNDQVASLGISVDEWVDLSEEEEENIKKCK